MMNKYPVQLLEAQADLENRFTYHAPTGEQPQKYEFIRGQALDLAKHLVVLCPKSRELAVALTKLEECMMWANASIARNETEA